VCRAKTTAKIYNFFLPVHRAKYESVTKNAPIIYIRASNAYVRSTGFAIMSMEYTRARLNEILKTNTMISNMINMVRT